MSKDEKSRPDPDRRFNAPKALGVSLGRLTRPALKKRGAAFGDILARWREIAGPMLAAETQPERLIYAAGAGAGATLEIAVSPAFALEVQHLTPLIIDKINGYFGYRAVAGLRLKQMPIRQPESAAAPSRIIRPLTADEQARLAAMLDGVVDRDLRQALEKLGRSLLGAQRR
ncbi:DUF721 domain-containing protein [Ferrovibrio xuzhouensis]|uniref:DUF721 domain-containing protein n=1 Tax=Ferrovibrio xuzhouensis TaxID=1576914 RepID=A0ABV7VHF7_9PROT